ncbi:MAG: hypothetical protein JOZ44_08595 [Acidobacteria bacterium]|nr:hypothetical protein [Acidobacteriota bacterium]
MVRHAVRAGMLYGIAVHLFMNFIVLPLSNVHHRPFQPGIFFLNMLEHMFLVGLPIALAVQRLSSQSNEVVLSQSDVEVDSKIANA